MQDASVVAIVLLSICLSCPAQSKEKVALEIGSITVYLNMRRTDVVERLATAGYKQVGGDKNTIIFQIGNAVEAYTVQFRNDRLIYADRERFLPEGNLDAFQSTIAALGAIADNERSPLSCTVIHIPIRAPDRGEENIFISCGGRTIQLSTVRFNGRTMTGYSVQEQIGERLTPK